MNNTEIIVPIILYGVLWGAFHFWGYDKSVKKVLANPQNYSKFTVAFCKKLGLFPQLLVSFVTALLVPLLGIGIMVVVSYMCGLLIGLIIP
jgi:hypothetical protein